MSHAPIGPMKSTKLSILLGIAFLPVALARCSGTDSVAGANPEMQLDASTSVPDGSPPPLDAAIAEDASLSFCDDVKVVESGSLCAIKPSGLDPKTKDIYGTASMPDQRLGFGYHVVGIPKNFDPAKGLWIHFSGTYGRPYEQGGRTFDSSIWLNEILAKGFAVIQPAYDNRFSVNETCAKSKPSYNRDNCAGEIREEVLSGIDKSPYADVDSANGADYRLRVLLNALKGRPAIKLPAGLDPNNLNWSDTTVSGHSQGGNLAYYVARFRGVKFACMLGSPYDVGDSVNPGAVPIADWFTLGTSRTPTEKLGQFITVQDDNYNSFRSAAAFLGLTPGEQSFEANQPPYKNQGGEEIDGHAASLADPALRTFREQACFR